jgi:hypothetical protein
MRKQRQVEVEVEEGGGGTLNMFESAGAGRCMV